MTTETGVDVRALHVERPLLLQIRVNDEEKRRILELAKEAGCETISAYMRRVALRLDDRAA